jgi:tetratricopeptide (TPR) repeat protein
MQAGLNAIDADPSLALSYLNVSGAAYFSGDDEKNLQYEREGLKRLESDTADFSTEGRAALHFENTAVLADMLGDFQQAARNYQALASGPIFENWKPLAPLGQSYELARQHDVAGSLAIMANHPVADGQALEFLSQMTDDFVSGYERDAALDDWTAAATDMQDAISAAPRWPAFAPIAVPLLLRPRLAYALARAGRQAEAESTATDLPRTCSRCARARGWIATTAHDWPRADREFAEAVRQGPSLPFGYADWGASLLARGETDGAIMKFSAAHARGPHFADALELWGEALLAKGDYAAAIAKFQQAAQFAPRWGHLFLMWGGALDRSGKHDAALAQYRTAAGMDLSVADRAALGSHIQL